MFPPGLALLFVVGTPGRHSMGLEDEAEQSVERAGSESDLLSRHTQSDELTSPIVPGGDLDAEVAPRYFYLSDSNGSCTPAKLRLVNPHPMQDHRQLAGHGNRCLLQTSPLRHPDAPGLQTAPPVRMGE